MSAARPALDRLKRQWAALAALTGFLAAAVASLILMRVGPDAALRWSPPVVIGLVWFFMRLRKSLTLNHPPDAPDLYPGLGAANLVTVLRATLTASLAGFLFLDPARETNDLLEWAPGTVYLAAVALDAADGRIARRLQTVTRLGAYLDTHVDALGLLFAGLLLVKSAKAPWPYLGVGLGVYILQAAVGLRRRAGRAVGRVAPRPGARWVAGCEMAFAALALLPVFGPEATRPASWIMTLALAVSLGLDWCIVCGHAAEDGSALAPVPALIARGLTHPLPVLLRAAAATGWALTLGAGPTAAGWGATPSFTILVLAAVTLCVLGVATRAAAMLLSLLGALWLIPSMPGSTAAATLMATLSLMLTGAGHPRLRPPEDRLWK
jgi:CDP-diacylglycerol--glycerol-3-phosphate 3-phosphatidyltransferase